MIRMARRFHFQPLKKQLRLVNGDDEASIHDPYADTCLRGETGLLQPQAAQSDPGQAGPLLRVKLHGQEPFLFACLYRRGYISRMIALRAPLKIS